MCTSTIHLKFDKVVKAQVATTVIQPSHSHPTQLSLSEQVLFKLRSTVLK